MLRQIGRVFTRSYAAKASVQVTRSPKPGANVGHVDPRHEIMRKFLFEKEQKKLEGMTDADLERHETIETAYKMFRSEKSREMREARLAKFKAMEDAFKELELTDMRLLEDATRKSPNPLFPLQMRVPTDTPPKVIWNYTALSKQ
ncbi:54S ribosomal protein L28, mitochondrial [Smittium mucronatum]|uniref:Large ribosomal subunit protein mL40 n=1 Tax=Smittium mucronatum TaxID=133383 RepID=A0A1R0GY05_9FUNG|nr:54S ribosomal protein L28, mitochondrial [Smittium mucronatum]